MNRNEEGKEKSYDVHSIWRCQYYMYAAAAAKSPQSCPSLCDAIYFLAFAIEWTHKQ